MPENYHEEEILGKAYDSRLMRRLLAYLRPYWRVALFALLAILLFGILQAVPPYLLKVEVDRYLDPTAHARLPRFLVNFLSSDPRLGITQIAFLILLPTVVLTFALQFAQSFAMQVVGQRVMYDLRQQLFAHLQRLEMSFFDRNPVGRLVTRVTTDVDVLNDLFASGMVAIFGDVFSLVTIVVVMLKMDYKLALLTFSVLPVIVVVTSAFRRAVRESYRRIRVAIARINAYLQEHITGMSVLQLFNHEDLSFREFEKINTAHMEAYKDSILAYGLFYPAVEFLGSVAVAIILYQGGGMALRGLVTAGTAIAFIQYAQRFFRPIQDLSDKYNILQAAMASAERIFKLLDTPVRITDPQTPVSVVRGPSSIQADVSSAAPTDHEQGTSDQQQPQPATANGSRTPERHSLGGIPPRLLCLPGRASGAGERLLYFGPWGDGGGGGPHGRRQDHPDKPAAAFLQRRGRAGAVRGCGHPPPAPARFAPQLRHRPPGPLPVFRHHRRQYSLGKRWDQR